MSGLSDLRDLLNEKERNPQGSGDFSRTTENGSESAAAPPTTELADQLQFAASFLSDRLFSPVLGVALPPVMIVARRCRPSLAGASIDHVWCKKSQTHGSTAQIELNAGYFQDMPRLLQTITHELSHHAQDAYPEVFGKPGRGGYHNKAWARLLERLGLRPISLDKPGKKTGYRVTDEVIAGGPFATVCAAYAATGATVSWAAAGPQPENAPQPEDERRQQKNKTTFRCPNCAQKTYGQRTLKVGCWICQVQMVSTSMAASVLTASQSNLPYGA